MTMSVPLPLPELDALACPSPVAASTLAAPISTAATRTIRALHLVNGEHYSGAERVQDLLARQLPKLGCEVGFVCVKPRRFPQARESKSTPLFEMPMHGRFEPCSSFGFRHTETSTSAVASSRSPSRRSPRLPG